MDLVGLAGGHLESVSMRTCELWRVGRPAKTSSSFDDGDDFGRSDDIMLSLRDGISFRS